MSTPLKAIIVGAGHRAITYASYAESHPDKLQIVGVADPTPLRREQTAARFSLTDDQCYESAEQLAALPKRADFIINGTMDHQHVPTSLPLLERGYDMLLEKPFATSEEEMEKLVAAAQKKQAKVAICHVLRYTPFYATIRQHVADGAIGEVLSVQAVEHVSYHHMAVGFIRGKWSQKDHCHSPMLMAKSCHDLDMISWMKSGVQPTRISSFGSNFQFRPEKAPENSGTRCIVDCPIEATCLYSARKHYIDHPQRWSFYVWDSLEHIEAPSMDDKLESLKTSPYGQCVWKTDMDVVDHQSVVIEFADGCTATLNMIGGTAKPSRSIHLVGTKGEIQGTMEDSTFVLRHIDPRPGCEYSEEIIDVNVQGDMTGAQGGHGGGDMRLVEDFIKVLNGAAPSISSTPITDSINGHRIGFIADRAMQMGQTITLDNA